MDGPLVKIEMMAEREVAIIRNGREGVERVPTNAIEPGSTLFYTINLHNEGNRTAHNVEVNNPIPQGAIYVPNSARGKGSKVLISTDNGTSFATETNGLLPESITHVRWVVDNMPAGSRRKLEFQVVASESAPNVVMRAWLALYLWVLAAFSK